MPRSTGIRLRTIRAAGTAILAAVMLGAGLTVSAAPANAAEDPTDVDSYAPAGAVNLALAGRVSASDSQGGGPPVVLNDGNSGSPDLNVWVAADTGVDAGGFVQVDLADESIISRIVVFPRGDTGFYGVYYPTEFTVSIIDVAGATVFEQRITHADEFDGVVDSPDVIDLDTPVEGLSVRIDVTTRQSREGGILQFSEIAVFGEPNEIPDYRPEGTDNLALTSRATASSSYEMPGESWSTAFAIDGDTGRTSGWTTDPYEKIQDPAAEASLRLALRCPSDLSRVVIYPRTKSFPRDFRIEVSTSGASWHTVAESLDNPGDQADPVVLDIDPEASARFVRLVVDERNGPDGADGYLVQLAEIAVYGTSDSCVGSVKPALLLEPGTTDSNWFEEFGTVTSEYDVASSDEGVATVAQDGTITAVAPGTATITLTSDDTTLTIPVEVDDDIERIGDDFTITVFWAPLPEYVNDEQYDFLAEAGIDVVQASQLTATPEVNLEMARLAHERGMQTIVQDETVTSRFTTMTADEAAAWAQRYTNVPGVGGFYLVDEPLDATAYATAFNAIRATAPEYYAHLNFFPYWFYGSEDDNDAAMQAWLDATGPRTMSDRDYLMYDQYPFQESGTDTASLLTNLNTVRELGLKNQVKTAMYLQSIGIPGNLRRPVPDEIRYEANLAMAYGYKQLSYFTWWTPTNRGEPFTDGIMTAAGEPTDLYAPVQALNSEIHALGPTLMRLDATEVYVAGTAHGQTVVPDDFFVQPTGDADLVLSRMVDRESGEEYLFVVNNTFTDAQDAVLDFADPGLGLQEVSRLDGTLGETIELADSVLTRNLAASEGVLFKVVDTSEEPSDSDTDGGGDDAAGGNDSEGTDDTGGTDDSSTDGTADSGAGGADAADSAATGGSDPAGATDAAAADGPEPLPSTGVATPWSAVLVMLTLLAAGLVILTRRRANPES